MAESAVFSASSSSSGGRAKSDPLSSSSFSLSPLFREALPRERRGGEGREKGQEERGRAR